MFDIWRVFEHREGRVPLRLPPTGFIPAGANVERKADRPTSPLNFFHYRDKPGRITRKPQPVDALCCAQHNTSTGCIMA
jgi:hypothetical protein